MRCVVPTDAPEKELMLVHEAVPDTISPWDSIMVVFSLPLQDSMVQFTMTPSFYMYSQRMSDSRDTIIISSAEPFDGNTRYVIRLQESITAENGVSLDRQEDSLVFVTAPSEKEPNDDLLKADSLENYSFGTVATVSDTDCFLLTARKIENILLFSFTTQSTCSVFDSEGNRTGERTFAQEDTIPVPDDFTPPLYVKVFSYYRSAGGSYRVGVITPED